MTTPAGIGFLARVTCNQCGATALTQDGMNFGAAVVCNCCDGSQEGHHQLPNGQLDHDAHANSCPEAGFNHEGVTCPHDAGNCNLWNSVQYAAATAVEAGHPKPDFGHPRLGTDYDHESECPGEHCGVGVEGCTVCRPVTIDILSLGAPV